MQPATGLKPASSACSTAATAGLLALAIGAACATGDSGELADRAAWAVLEPAQKRFETERAAQVLRPSELPEPPPAEQAAVLTAPAQAEPALLDLPAALARAFEGNREFRSERESLFLTAMSVVGARHSFAPIWSASLNAALSDASADKGQPTLTASGGVNQDLPWGGSLGLTGTTSHSAVETSVFGSTSVEELFDSSLSLQYTQPLLRGAGTTVARESLTQAERTLVYEIRAFELFREDFAIQVAGQYYSLVQQKQAVGNQKRNLEGLEYARRQAEALHAVGRKSELDVLRARRSELSSRNDLIEAEESLTQDLEEFRIFLGLPEGARVDVGEESPPFVPVRWDVDSATRVALANRLDWRTRQEQLEDADRAVRIARNALMPQLDLTLSYGLDSQGDASFLGQALDEESWSAGLNLELPVDQVIQRNSLRSAEIARDRERRSTEQFRQNLMLEVRSAFRELERRRQSLEIQRQLIDDQERNVRVAQLQFERGDLPNRDVVEAQQSLLEAQNSLVGEQVAYELARLGLLRDLGTLFIDDRGMFIE
jgi:outer membrane protein TolC